MKTMLEHLRETAGLTQRELAQRAGVTQETVSQLENGKVDRPRLDTLTKLRAGLDLTDLDPKDLLELCPLEADPEVGPAITRLVGLLKVLPLPPDPRLPQQFDAFWTDLDKHLGYDDHYPVRKLASWVIGVQREGTRDQAARLAEYTLMFFDPDDEALLAVLRESARIGPTTAVARRWCRDVTDAAWTIHRASLTSYPAQIGRYYSDATKTTDPQRLAELAGSVYDFVRGEALVRSAAADQVRALQQDPSDEVVYIIASRTTDPDVQQAALQHPRAWTGLAFNADLHSKVAGPFTDAVLASLHTADAEHAGSALHRLAGRIDLGRPLLQQISERIDCEGTLDDPNRWVDSAVLEVRDSLNQLDEDAATAEQKRAQLRVINNEDHQGLSRWRHLLSGR